MEKYQNQVKDLLKLYGDISISSEGTLGDSFTSIIDSSPKEINRDLLGELFYDQETEELYVMIENMINDTSEKIVIKDIVDFKKLITLKLLKD